MRTSPARPGKTRGYGADLIEGLVQPGKPFGLLFRLRLLQPAREVAQLTPQPLQSLGLFRGAKGLVDACAVRDLAEPRMQLVQRLFIAALALLDPLDQLAQQALDALPVWAHGSRCRLNRRRCSLANVLPEPSRSPAKMDALFDGPESWGCVFEGDAPPNGPHHRGKLR